VAGSDEAHAAFVEKLFHCAGQAAVQAYGPKTLPESGACFCRACLQYPGLMVEIMAATALTRYNNAQPCNRLPPSPQRAQGRMRIPKEISMSHPRPAASF